MKDPHTLPEEAQDVSSESETREEAQSEALVQCLRPATQEPLTLSAPVARLPVELDVAIPVGEFRVRNLVDLRVGQLIETQWEHTEDLPLAAREVQLAWSEFEVVNGRLGVRITRPA